MSYRCPVCAAPVEADGCAEHPGDPLAIAAGDDPLYGARIDGRFVVLGPLGRGGMGVLYRGWQVSTGREVAIKVLEKVDAGDALGRFRREARITARLRSPHVVTVLDTGALPDARPYLVMELLRGRSLAEVLLDGPALTPADAAAIGAQICLALAEAHAAGVVHRDLKPGNIMLERLPDGRPFVRVLDFGLAKLTEGVDQSVVTHANATPGTPAYMSPEQIRGQAVGPATDLYAVGLILFELATGERAYPQSALPAIFTRKLLEDPPRLPDSPPALAALGAVVERCLARDSAARPASAEVLRSALETLDDAAAPSPPTPAPLPETLDDVDFGAPVAGAEPASVVEPASVPAVAPASAVEPIPERAPPVDPVPALDPAPRGVPLVGVALLVVALGAAAWIAWPRTQPVEAADSGAVASAAPTTTAPTTAAPTTAAPTTAAPPSAPATEAPPTAAPPTAAPPTSARRAAPATRARAPKPRAVRGLRATGIEVIGLDDDGARAALRGAVKRGRCRLAQPVRISVFVSRTGGVSRAKVTPADGCVERLLKGARFPAAAGGFGTVRARIEEMR